MKNNYLKTFIFACCFSFVLILFAGCGYIEYSGPHADLYTVAINSVLWNCGHSRKTDFFKDSEIEIIETDEFGRTLYRYEETCYNLRSLWFSALIVSQYTFDDQVYYYEDFNYIVKDRDISRTFEQDEIEQLKAINDWGKPLNADKCIGKTITNSKPKNAAAEAVKDKLIKEYNLSFGNYGSSIDYLTEDNNSNIIFYGVIEQRNGEDYIFFVAFVSADGDIKLFTPSDLYNYNEELKAFKEENGWVSK